MAGSDPVPQPPDPQPPGTTSWETRPPFDIFEIAPTASLPEQPTATFGGDGDTPTPPGDGSNTPGGGEPDLPQIPGYRVLRFVSGGGMGSVFKAIHLATNRLVALKLINAGWAQDNNFRARFAREARTLAALEHPNVVPIYDAGSWQGLPYLTMKFVDGKTLAHHLPAIRRDLRNASELMVKIARAVQYLHDKGIVHRDLKPLNILMAADGTPMVADFGLVRPIEDDSELSLTMVPLGTRHYMSPEQTRGGKENYTPACDIWALGVILYEILAGRRPYRNEDTVELFRQIRQDPLPQIPPEANAPPGLEAIARRCLAKEAADRYPTAAALADDLERWLAGTFSAPMSVAAPAAPRAMARVRGGRRVRRALASVALLALLGFSGFPAPTRSEPPQEPSLPERLERGETVWLIGADGLPRVPNRALPGCFGAVVTRRGYASISSAGVTCIELSSGPLPWPVRLRAECAMTVAMDSDSEAGVFAGGKETPWKTGPFQTLLTAGFRAPEAAHLWGGLYVTKEQSQFAFLRWHDTPPGSRRRYPPANRTALQVLDLGRLDWHTIDLVIRPEALSGSVAGTPLPTVYGPDTPGVPPSRCVETEFKTLSRSAPPGTLPAFAPPYLGDGIGLYVFNAEAVYRNVTLARIAP